MNLTNANAEMSLNLDIKNPNLEASIGNTLSWHEDISMSQCALIPTDIHANLRHIGGVGISNLNLSKSPD